VKEKQTSIDWAGGINYDLGNEFDYDGPMLMVSRTTYKADHSADEILHEVDAIVADLQQHGPTAREVADAKVRFRSSYYDSLETTGGKANLLASFALFRDDPSQINKVLPVFDSVTASQIQTVAQKYLGASNRTSIDRVPAPKEAK
jgi:zinc protease